MNTDQDNWLLKTTKEIHQIWVVWRVDHKKAKTTKVYTSKCCQNEINQLMKKAQFKLIASFSTSVVAAEYDLPFKILRGRIREARKRYKTHAEAQKLTTKQEKMIQFGVNFNQTESDEMTGHCQVLPAIQ